MKSTLSLLAITAVFGAFLAAPLAARTGATGETERLALPTGSIIADDLLLFADNDEGDDEGDDDEGDDDEGDDDEGDDDEGDDDDNRGNGNGCDVENDQGYNDHPCNTGMTKPVKRNTSPPKNGLFGNGAAPKAQVN